MLRGDRKQAGRSFAPCGFAGIELTTHTCVWHTVQVQFSVREAGLRTASPFWSSPEADGLGSITRAGIPSPGDQEGSALVGRWGGSKGRRRERKKVRQAGRVRVNPGAMALEHPCSYTFCP